MKNLFDILYQNQLKIQINIAVFYLIGIVLHMVPFTQNLMKTMTPFVLFILGTLTLLMSRKLHLVHFRVWLISCFFITLILEMIGVATGKIFGDYYYGNVLGFQLLGVPVVIGLNWVLVILGLLNIIRNYIKNFFWGSLITALACVIFDYLMEPVAVWLGYWVWEKDIIPIQNYFSWFIIAFIFSIFYYKTNIREIEKSNHVPFFYVVLQLVFFLALRIYILII